MKQISIYDGSNTFTLYDNSQNTILRSFEGFEYPSVSAVIEDLPGRSGSLFIDSKLRRRRLSIQGDLIGDTVFQLRRLSIAPLKTGELLLLRFTTYDDLELQARVSIDRFTMPYTHQLHQFLIEMVAPDFRFYSQTLKSQSTSVTTLSGGTPVPAAVPAPIGGGSSLFFNLNNSGTFNSPPVFIIRGPGTNFVVQNITTGHKFNLNLTLLANEQVTITTLDKTVIKGTNQSVFGSFVGTFFELGPGNNVINFNATTGVTANTQLTVRYRDAYLGI